MATKSTPATKPTIKLASEQFIDDKGQIGFGAMWSIIWHSIGQFFLMFAKTINSINNGVTMAETGSEFAKVKYTAKVNKDYSDYLSNLDD